MLMGVILVAVFTYAKLLGARNLTEAAPRGVGRRAAGTRPAADPAPARGAGTRSARSCSASGRGSRCSTCSCRSSSSSCSRSTTTKGRFNLTWQGFTLRTGSTPSRCRGLGEAMGKSLEIALISTVLALALGTFMALALVRYQFRGPQDDRHVRLPAAGDARGRARRRAARAVPHDERRHRLRHDRDRPRDVQRLVRRGDREGAARGDGPPHRGGGDGPRRERVDDVPQDHPAPDRAGRGGGGAARRSRSRSTTS